MPQRQIKRALISVYDKTGIVDFARALVEEFRIEVISTGGTAKLLKESGVPVTLVEEITGFPEMLDGRVKTLHPKIHAGILADRDNPEHMRQLKEQGLEPIDMVVVNLYPFEKTVADPDCTFEQAIEMIDIGGPCLLRAAAKNHKHVLSADDPRAYEPVLAFLRAPEEVTRDLNAIEAMEAFTATTRYDAGIVQWLTADERQEDVPPRRFVEMSSWGRLRYGENPHQVGELTECEDDRSDEAIVIYGDVALPEQGKLSYNNYADAHAALELCKELTRAPSPLYVGPTFQSVIPPVTDERHTERHLPHIQNPGSHYFLTFRLKSGTLGPEERQIVLNACTHWHGQKMTLHACVVMPDHVHLLLTPHEVSRHKWVPLGEITRSIKGHSAREVNKRRGRTGSIWLDESWGRIVRNEKEYDERWEYIENNPAKAGLEEPYPWVWLNRDAWRDLAAYHDRLESRSHGSHVRVESRSHKADDRLESRSHIPENCSRRKACAFIKHTNACGVGIGSEAVEAYRWAYLGDPNAAMGGVLACNFSVDAEFAAAVMDSYATWGKQAGAGGFFVEVWIAPKFTDDAVDRIRKAKAWGQRVRVLSVGDMSATPNADELEYKSITGGMLVQSRDLVGLNEDQWKVVTKRGPTDSEMADLRLAWLVAKHTKSNAISICKDGMLIGNGAGQMSRVMSCRIATWLAKENGHGEKLEGSAAASDAFFPFPDGPGILIDAGVTAIIQPGGSKRDAETIAACNDRDVAMVFTGTRHFKH